MLAGNQKLIAIGASTGGVDAVERILERFPASIPPVVVAVHMAAGISRLFAERLDEVLPFSVKEAENGDFLAPGQVLVAPGGKHMKIVNHTGRLAVECYVGPKINHVIPSVDILFESIAPLVRNKAVGVILTGIGVDGAKGLLQMRENGATTIGQDEKSCVVYGMPKVAMAMGAVQHQLAINMIADKILSFI